MPPALHSSERPVHFRIRYLEDAASIPATPSSGYFSFSLPGVARYEVRAGEEILVEPVPGTDWATVRLFLLSTGLGALLHQRCIPALHGTCIAFSGGAVIFAGPSGAGKSTLAAAFYNRGYTILAEEISALQISGFPLSADVSVFQGATGLMLWSDALENLRLNPSGLVPVRPEIRKYLLPTGFANENRIIPLRRVFILETSPNDLCLSVPLEGIAKFKVLSENLYRRGIAADMGVAGSLAPLIASLAAKAEVSRLIRPRNRFAVDELVGTVERDLA